MSGGALFGFLGHLTAKRGRDPIIITGFVLSMLSYFLMFLNLPFNSNLGETQPSDTAYITSNQYLAVFTGFILGFSDSCFNTQVSAHWTKYIIFVLLKTHKKYNLSLTSNVIQITSILGGAFKEQSAAGFAIFKFMQSFSCAIAFFYSRYN